MRHPDSARISALALVGAVAACVAAGVAALAREGVCIHHLSGLAPDGAAGMPGMTMSGDTMSGPCPILVAAAAVAALLCLGALVALAVLRPPAADVALASARIVLGLQAGRLTALLAVTAAIPLGAALVMEGSFSALAGGVAAVVLIATALLSALALRSVARVVVAFARRLAGALAVAFALAPNLDAPWRLAPDPMLVHAGVRLARRRPSRAPPDYR